MSILPNLNAPRILVVEDKLNVADQLAQMLREAGYYVQNAYNHGDAFAVDHQRFDLAIVNGNMHDRDGTPILDDIVRHPTFKHLPLLAMTDDAVLVGGKKALQRPYDDQALLLTIARLVGKEPKPDRAGQPGSVPRRKTLTESDAPTEPRRVELDALLEQQLGELKTLSMLGRSISSVLELSEVLNQIVEASTTLTRAEEGMLLLPDDEGKALFLRAMKGVDDASARNFRIKIEDPLVGRVYISGKPVLIGDRGLQRVKTEYFVKSLLYVPMTYKGQTIGVLGVNNRNVERVFTHHDQDLLLDLAAHAAIAIENARLYEESLLQNRQLMMLVSAAQAVNSTLALEDVLSSICEQMIRTLEVNGCLISQQDPNTGQLYVLASARRIVRRPDQRWAWLLEDRPVLKRAIEQNAFYAVKRNKKDTNWLQEQKYLERDNVDQMVVLPIRPTQQAPIGVMELFYYGDAPEITSEFRGAVRGLALESLALLTDRSSSTLPLGSLIGTAQKMLDVSRSDWLRLSLILEGRKLVTLIDYGTAVSLNSMQRGRAIYPDSMAAFSDQPVLNHHVREAALPSAVREAMATYGADTLVSFPLIIKGNPFGAVTVYTTQEARSLRPTEISMGRALVTQAASALENAELYRDLERSLTELRQAQAKLVQAARLSTMGELAAVVAHQINNPLTTIMGDAELLLEEMDDSHPWRDGVTAIHRAGKRAHAVVKRLLSTTRRGNADEAPQRIEVHETIYNTLELVTTHIERSKIRFEISLDEKRKGYVFAAPGHLEDLWLNLLLNARDALISTPEAVISIHSQYADSALQVSVCDNGSGIPEKYLDHIFDAFFTTKPTGEGTGLGLYICRQIVTQCHGTIQVETSQGKGTCFRVTLPVESQGNE